jgi:hypothetical protein
MGVFMKSMVRVSQKQTILCCWEWVVTLSKSLSLRIENTQLSTDEEEEWKRDVTHIYVVHLLPISFINPSLNM